MPDSNFALVTALLPADPPNGVSVPPGSNAVFDLSGGASRWGIYGSATVSDTWAKFGEKSLRVDSNSAFYRSDNRVAAFGSKPFCIEGWIFADSVQTTSYPIVAASFPNSSFTFVSGAIGVFCDHKFAAPGKLSLVVANYGPILQSTTNPLSSGPIHFAFTRNGNTWRAFIDGALEDTETWNGEVNDESATHWFSLGSDMISGGDSWFAGYIDDFRITIGNPRYTAAFSPPTSPFEYERTARLVAKATRRALPVYDFPAQPRSRVSRRLPYRRDAVWTGTGRIVGTVKQKATPTNVPLARRVLLLDETTNIVMRETWSDATTGAYTFERIDRNRRYSVITYDYAQNYRAVIADNLVPEAMP